MNKPNLKVFETVDNLLFSLADSFVEIGNEAIEDDGHFNVVLSGGSSPKKLYELLASPAYRNKLEVVHLRSYTNYWHLQHIEISWIGAKYTSFLEMNEMFLPMIRRTML